MARRGHATAVSAIVITLSLGGIGVVAAAPFMGTSANAASEGSRLLARAVPSQLDPSDNAGPEEPEDPVVTVTTTTTPPPEPGPTDVTVTVTVTPPKTKKPKESKPPTRPAPPPTTTQAPAPPPPIPPTSQEIQPPPTAVGETTPEQQVELPPVPDVSNTPLPSTTETPPASDSVQVQLREAAPEYDQALVSRQLGIPALILVLLALFAVLVFEGRLRRMAHAAAVRKAGPRPPGRHRGDAPDGGMYAGYPAGPGYASGYVQAGYPGGTAYAPIISFVPIQTYPQPGYPADQGQAAGQGGQGFPMGDPAMPYGDPAMPYGDPATLYGDPQQYGPPPAQRDGGPAPRPDDLPRESFAEGPHDLTPFDPFTPRTPAENTSSPAGTPTEPTSEQYPPPGFGPAEELPATPQVGPEGTAMYPLPPAGERPSGRRRKGRRKPG